MKKYLLVIALILSFVCISCSSSDEHRLSEKEMAKMTVGEKINYLYTVFPDTATVSRILCAFPNNIDRIQKNNDNASPKFVNRLNEVCNFYLNSDYNNAKTLREYDPEFSWYDKVWDMDSLYGWYWFWGGLVVLLIISLGCENIAPILIGSILYFVCGLISFISFCNSSPIEVEPYPSIVEKNVNQNNNKNNYSKTDIRLDNKKDNEDGKTEVSAKNHNTLVASNHTDTIQQNSVAAINSNDSVISNMDEEVASNQNDTVNQDSERIATLTRNDTVNQESDNIAVIKQPDSISTNTNSVAAISQNDSVVISENKSNPKNDNNVLLDSKAFKAYSQCYDYLTLNGISLDSLSVLTGVKKKQLVMMRFGLDNVPENIGDFLQAFKDAQKLGEDFGVEEWAEKIKGIKISSSGQKISLETIQDIETTRNMTIDETLASITADYYSNAVDAYLEDKFGFWGSIWQGVKYIFTSKENYVKQFENELSDILSKEELSKFILYRINGFRRTMEYEHYVLLNIPEDGESFKNLTLFASNNPFTEEIRNKLIERGSLEASDICSGIMFDIIGWLVCTLILGGLCTYFINKAKEDELIINGLIDRWNPDGVIKNILKYGAKFVNSALSNKRKQEIEDRYARYKAIANISVIIVSYIVTYFFFIEPSVKLEVEINEQLTSQFLEYYQSLEIPVSEQFQSITDSLDK